jgi:hypothetical protein
MTALNDLKRAVKIALDLGLYVTDYGRRPDGTIWVKTGKPESGAPVGETLHEQLDKWEP